MRRREFIAGLAGAAAWPMAARAQQGGQVRRLGVLMASSESDPMGQARIAALRQALAGLGWSEGGNLKIDWRWTGGDIDRVRDYAAELVRLAPDVIIANGTPCSARIASPTLGELRAQHIGNAPDRDAWLADEYCEAAFPLRGCLPSLRELSVALAVELRAALLDNPCDQIVWLCPAAPTGA